MKALRRAKLHVRRVWRHRRGDIARNRQRSRVRLRRVRMACRRDLYRRRCRQDRRCGVNAIGPIVPDAPFPPGTSFTLQLTAVSVVFITFAENAVAFPSITDPLFGEIVTVTDGGGGSGGTDVLAPPAPQPMVHAPVASRTDRKNLAVWNPFRSNGERSRMPYAKAGKGPAKIAGYCDAWDSIERSKESL